MIPWQAGMLLPHRRDTFDASYTGAGEPGAWHAFGNVKNIIRFIDSLDK